MEWKRGATNGTVLAGGNGKGNRPDQLNQPTDVIFDKETDSLIICDRGNLRVTRWPRQSGTRSGEAIIINIECYGLAVDDVGSLYVADTNQHEVRRFDKGETNGTLVAGGNGIGAGLQQLNDPHYVGVDGEHAVYVSDNYNHRVMKWAKSAKKGILVAGGPGYGKDLTQLHHPDGVLVDRAGSVYLVDSWNQRVMRWRPKATEGTVIVGGNERGEAANQLHGPFGLFFDFQGHLYVSEEWNHRVQRFSVEKN
jgi:sugar lactone lactonase YvrE